MLDERDGDVVDLHDAGSDIEGLANAPRPTIWCSQPFDGTVVIRVRGELDIVGAADLRAALGDQRDARHHVLLDLGRVESIHTSAISVLIDALREFTRSDLRLKLYRSLRPPVRRLLMDTGAIELLQTF